MNTEAKPFVKWAGGKGQLLDELTKNLSEFRNYHEPFVGGGALFFRLDAIGKITNAYLNDSNKDLMNAYKVIKENVDSLIKELTSEKYQNKKEIYYRIRAEEPEDEVKRAARFIYLNKTAYNGLYRVNSKGKFNVPFGKYANPTICDAHNLRLVSHALQKAELFCEDFSMVLKYAQKEDLVYLDPPYFPLTKTANFTGYTPECFTRKDQDRLHEVFKQLDSKGCFVMLSNSYQPYIEGLYQEFKPEIVYAARAISCKAEGRGKIKELLVRNWWSSKMEA